MFQRCCTLFAIVLFVLKLFDLSAGLEPASVYYK